MSYTLLISTDELAHHLDDPDWAVIDCRFDLNDPAKGRAAYLDAHIPGAIYAHLDEDLSSPIVPGATGRHPLPTPDVFAARLSRWGIDEKTQVVVYDDAGGLYAGRLWWMLRWLGHDAVALLDGGWQQWLKEVRPTLGGEDTRSPRTFVPHVQEEMLADVDEVLANLENDEFVLVDVREPNETASERIPGATFPARCPPTTGTTSRPMVVSRRRTNCAPTTKICWPTRTPAWSPRASSSTAAPA